jgi:chromosome segregation ATPase
MDYAKGHFYLTLINALFSLLAIAYSWWNSREKVIKGRFEHQTKDIENLKNDMKTIKETGPKALDIETLKSDVKAIKENVPTHCNGHQQLVSRMDGHNDRLGQHKDLLTAIETDLKHLPNNEAIGKLHEKINSVHSQMMEVKSEVSKISGAMPGISHLTEMMNEFLLNNGIHKHGG